MLVTAFSSLYLVWGSTYLAIRVVVETLPPFLMASLRFTIAGGLLLGFLRLRGESWPTWRQWRIGAIVGTLLLFGGNGLVSWAEQTVASGLASLILATTPLWFVIFEWLPPWRKRPELSTLLGLALGFGGICFLVSAGPGAAEATPEWSWAGVIALLTACVSWVSGSLVQRRAGWAASPSMNAAVQMVCGAGTLLLVGTLTGEWSRMHVEAVSTRSVVALVYLIVFGSWVGFGAYVWLLKHTTPTRLATYAYVNPVIAVILGWLVLDEPITLRVAYAGLCILASVVIVQWPRRPSLAEPQAHGGKR
jgi:drug/metabolite transporter (DMT)-like permease